MMVDVRLRLSLLTLGVEDLRRSIAFYEALGLPPSMTAGNESVAFLDTGHVVLGLFGRGALAEDVGVPDTATGFPAVTLACNLPSEQAVLDMLAAAERFGGRIVKPGQRAFWGGFSGYFADPDGHLWEVAHNPDFPIDDTGRITLPG
jgi:uncharacterized protein